MLKLAGIVILLTGCIGMGISKVKDEKRRVRELQQIKRILIRIQNEMVYGKRTLPEICLLLSQCMEMPYQTIFYQIYQQLQDNRGNVLEEIWKRQMESELKELPLKKEERDILYSLPEHLGIQDETMQAADIGQSLDMLTAHIRQAESEYENKTKVIMSLSITAGLFLSIILL